MNITVRIDGGDELLRLLGTNFSSVVTDTVRETTLYAHREWQGLAMAQLGQARRAYLEGIQPPRIFRRTAHLGLRGWLPTAIERGIPRFDMKPGLLASPRARASRSTGQRYIRVPIQRDTIRTVSEQSSPSSWWHPGIRARRFLDRVNELATDFMVRYAERAVHQALSRP